MKIYNEDCLETLKTIPDETIDLVVTDCPYHIVSGGCTTGTYGHGQIKNIPDLELNVGNVQTGILK